MSTTTTASVSTRDQIVKQAQSVVDLVSMAQSADPQLAGLLTGAYAKQAWWPAVVSVVAGVGAKFGLSLDSGTAGIIAGGVLIVGTGLYHWLAPKIAPAMKA